MAEMNEMNSIYAQYQTHANPRQNPIKTNDNNHFSTKSISTTGVFPSFTANGIGLGIVEI